MRCEIHGKEMEYVGEDPFGGDIWRCEQCYWDEEYENNACPNCGELPEDCICELEGDDV